MWTTYDYKALFCRTTVYLAFLIECILFIASATLVQYYPRFRWISYSILFSDAPVFWCPFLNIKRLLICSNYLFYILFYNLLFIFIPNFTPSVTFNFLNCDSCLSICSYFSGILLSHITIIIDQFFHCVFLMSINFLIFYW